MPIAETPSGRLNALLGLDMYQKRTGCHLITNSIDILSWMTESGQALPWGGPVMFVNSGPGSLMLLKSDSVRNLKIVAQARVTCRVCIYRSSIF